jgi:FtsZ-binding cell division protein ZapB
MNTQPPEQNPHDYDEVTRLRLQLHHVEIQRDGFAAALKTDVLKIAKVAIYQAMLDADSKAADTIGCIGVELDDVKAENARLKAEVTDLKSTADGFKNEVARLKSDTARLKNNTDYLDQKLDEEIARAASFAGEIARLRKFGTEMGKYLPDTDEANRAYIDFEAGGRS